MSAASHLDDSTPDEAEDFGPVSESSRPTEPRSRSVPPPPMRDQLSTLELELERLDELGGDAHFDFHDTIPAPPWLDEFGDAENALQPLPPPPAR